METYPDIRYLTNEEINFVKWDNCINNSHNGNIYAFSWYLDIISEDWEALIGDDYESVMPLMPSKKAGIPMIFTTYLANQLGVFSTNILSEEKVNAFIKKLSEVYKVFDVNLNKFNKVNPNLYRQKFVATYEFDIIGDYKTITEGYSREIADSIKKAEENNISVVRGLLPNDFLGFSAQETTLSSVKLRNIDLTRLRRIISFVMRHGLGEIYAAYGPPNELVAAVFFLKSNRKINVLFSGVSKEGLQLNALHKILDQYIEKYSGQNLTLSFENLNVPDKAAFCKGFGGKEFYFSNVQYNNLSWHKKILYALAP